MHNHYSVMFVIMILAGALSTMNVWADTLDDIRFSLNDAYMILLMTGWMLLFMGLYYRSTAPILIGLALVVSNIVAIRTQAFVTEDQFLQGMIPHHSMAVLMSKRLIGRPNSIGPFLSEIITTQEKEITFMKKRLK